MSLPKLALIATSIVCYATVTYAQKSPQPRLCYQGVCLLDSVSELSMSVAAVRVPTKGSNVDEWSVKQAMDAFRVPDAVARQLLRAGFLFGEPNSLTADTLKLIQGVPAVCSDSAKPFQVHVRAQNGKAMILGYRALVSTDLAPTYRLTSIAVEFPEIQSNSERAELFQQASQSLDIKLQCSSAQASDCDVLNSSPQMVLGFWTGNLLFSIKDPSFSLDLARRHPNCRVQVRF